MSMLYNTIRIKTIIKVSLNTLTGYEISQENTLLFVKVKSSLSVPLPDPEV